MSLLLMLQLPLADFVWFQNVVLPVLGMGIGAVAMFGVYRTINRQIEERLDFTGRILAQQQRQQIESGRGG